MAKPHSDPPVDLCEPFLDGGPADRDEHRGELPPLPADLARVAEEQLGETPAVRAKALLELREKLQNLSDDDPKKPKRTDDAYLITFLRHAKFRVDRAFQKVTNMAAFLNKHADILKDIRAEEFRDMYHTGMLRVLRGKALSGARVNTVMPAGIAGYPGDDLWVKCLRFSVWSFEKLCLDPYMQVHGLILLENFDNFSWRSAIRVSSRQARPMLKKRFEFVAECAPFRLQGVIIAKEPVFIDFLWVMAKSWMKRKMQDRVRFLGSKVEGFTEYVAPEELPPQFGGSCQEDTMEWLEEQIAAEANGQLVSGLRL